MSNKNKNIEDFFKKLSDGYQDNIGFNEEHWDQMESLLDEKMPFQAPIDGVYKLGNVFSSLATIILIIGMFWNFTIQRELKSFAENIRAEQSPTTKTEENSPITELAPSYESEPEEKLSNKNLAIENTFERPTDIVEKSLDIKISQKSQTSISVTSTDQSTIEHKEDDEIEQDKWAAERVGKSIPDSGVYNQVYGYKHLDGMPILFDSGTKDLPLEVEQAKVNTNYSTVKTIVESKNEKFSRWAIGLSVAPDFSSNQLMSYNRFSSGLGIFVEYRLSKKISLETGVLKTKKKYKVNGDAYAPPSGFWGRATGGEVPSAIDASCSVLDIPINLRYRLLENDQSSISFSAGVSSYIMISEDYQYTLTTGYWDWGIEGQNKHFFGVGNLQAYYERKLGKYFSIEAAPFIKLPLMGFGHGNIKFHSIGTYITVKRYFHLF